MKRIIQLVLLMMISIGTHAQFTKSELQVNGLTCSMCSLATQKQLQTLDFVDSIGTDLNHTLYILYFTKSATINTDLIRSKVEDAGFSIGSLIFPVSFDNVAVTDNMQYSYNGAIYQFTGIESQTLNGVVRLKIIDKGFVADKEYKEYLKKSAKYPTYKTGINENGQRVYHVTLI